MSAFVDRLENTILVQSCMFILLKVPATINQYLRKYQQQGIVFLYKQYSVGKGAILADDMGLGKTVQVFSSI